MARERDEHMFSPCHLICRFLLSSFPPHLESSLRPQLVAHLPDRQGLVECLQETVGIQLIEFVPGLSLDEIQGFPFLGVGIDFLGVGLAARVPEGIQEPDGLFLMALRAQFLEFGLVVAAERHGWDE